MRDYFELGSTPCDEDCVQVSRTADYMPAMRQELKRYEAHLDKILPVPEDIHAWYSIKWNSHDFGSYGEVAINFDDEDNQAIEFACFVEEHTPTTWDDDHIREYTPALMYLSTR